MFKSPLPFLKGAVDSTRHNQEPVTGGGPVSVHHILAHRALS
jgi:hypothetical protein